MASYAQVASKLIDDVRYEEGEQRLKDIANYDSHHLRQAIVHTREDICGVSAYLLIANNQLRTVRWLLSAIVVLLVVIAVELA